MREAVGMRLWRKSHREEVVRSESCEHTWRPRELPNALAGAFTCDVCDRCGTVRLGTQEATVAVPDTQGSGVEPAACVDRAPPPRPAFPPPGA